MYNIFKPSRNFSDFIQDILKSSKVILRLCKTSSVYLKYFHTIQNIFKPSRTHSDYPKYFQSISNNFRLSRKNSGFIQDVYKHYFRIFSGHIKTMQNIFRLSRTFDRLSRFQIVLKCPQIILKCPRQSDKYPRQSEDVLDSLNMTLDNKSLKMLKV